MLEKITILYSKTIRESLKKISDGGKQIVFVVDEENRLFGSVTDGDVRRWILKTGGIVGAVKDICNRMPFCLPQLTSHEEIQKTMMQNNINAIPIIDENKKIVDVIFLSNLISDETENIYEQIDLPVVIMAGGFGTRLEPFTSILPKPLIPIGNKPMLEVIMDEYAKFGMRNFFISVNHKAKMIKAYFEDHDSDYKFQYLEEDKPLGTAGSLKHLDGEIKTPFFVSNCDIIIKDDYTKIYDFHKKGNFDFTMVASMQHHKIPYGVCEIGDGGVLSTLNEKPEYNFLVNTGMYLLNPDILQHIPKNEFFHITHLMEKLQKLGKKIGVYPVSEEAYIDVGQWQEYQNAVKILGV